MNSTKNSTFKLGLYSDKDTSLLPIISVNLVVKIINKFSKVNVIHIYQNPYKENINATFLIPKEYASIFKSLNIEYNNKKYEGIINNKNPYIINYSENSQLQVLEYHKYKKKYLYFILKDIEPNNEIKIDINFIEILETKNNAIKYIIQKIYTPIKNELFYDYKYEINIINTKIIKNIFCNIKDIKINKINNNEYIIKYSNNTKDNKNNKLFIIEYEKEEKNESDIIIMKHPIYQNDYISYFSINPKYLIKEKNENKIIDKIIIMVNISLIRKNLKERIIQSIIYLLKSLPENICSFKIFFYNELFEYYMQVNQNNIIKILDKMEKYDFYDSYNSLEDKAYFLENIKNIKKEKEIEKNIRVFIIGDEFNDINNVLDEIDDFPENFRFYTIFNPYLKNNDEYKYFRKYKDFNVRIETDVSEEVKEISRRTNGNWAYFINIDDIPDILIEMYNESIEDYINDLSITFLNIDNNIICIQKEKYSINENIEFLINMSINNSIKINFKYKNKLYESTYNINLEKTIEIDDTLHKIFYHKYFYNNIILENKLNDLMNKYQIFTDINELYIDLKEENNDKKNLILKINKKRNKEMVFKPKGSKLHLYFQTLKGDLYDLILYSNFSIKETKILVDLTNNIFYKNLRFIYKGKASIEDDRVLSDYNVTDETTVHIVMRKSDLKFKNYFDLYDSKNIYLLIINQKLNGLWEKNENNIKLLQQFQISFSNFCNDLKDKNINIDDENILFTIYVISYLNSFPYKKRYKNIIEKSIKLLKTNIKDYNEEMHRIIDGFKRYNL